MNLSIQPNVKQMEIRDYILSLNILLFVNLCCFKTVGSNDRRGNELTVNIGVIFDKDSDALERAVNYGVEVANSTDSLLKIRAIHNETDISNSYKLGYSRTSSPLLRGYLSSKSYCKDVLSLNNDAFHHHLYAIFPPELKIKETTESATSASYLDLLLSVSKGALSTKLYDKREDFNFRIVNFPYVSSIIPESPAYGVYISQLIRYARAYQDFITRGRSLTGKLMEQGYTNDKSKIYVCQHLEEMTFALVSMTDIHSYDVIQTYSQALKVPFIVPSSPKSSKTDRYHYEIKMNPSYIPAMVSIIKNFKWRKIFYLYDKDDDLWRLQKLYEEFNSDSSTTNGRVTIVVRSMKNLAEAHDILRSLDKIGAACEEKVFILDFNTNETLTSILRKIIDVGMNRDGYHYLIGGLEIRDYNFRMFYHSGAVFTGFQLLDKESNIFLKNFTKKWMVPSRSENNTVPQFTVDLALMVDGIAVLTTALLNLYNEERASGTLNLFKPRRNVIYNTNDTQGVLCTSNPLVPFKNGHRVLNAMKNVTFKGLSGNIEFDEDGQRVNYYLDVYQSKYNTHLTKIGNWSTSTGLHIFGRKQTIKKYRSHVLVTTVLEEPFVMIKETNGHGKPEIEYEGYCVDLLNKIKATFVNFTYKIRPRKDEQYGEVNTTIENGIVNHTGDGMIGELMRGEADIALAPITIRKDRQAVIDFTKPFMKTGISIMIKRPEKQKPGVFSFKEPLSDNVWLCIIAGFLAVSFILFFVGRFSPYEWNNSSGPSTDFNMLNALWSSLGALMMQGSDIFPRSISGRTAESAWWFFTLILISSYTANLAAFLTIEQLSIPINSVDDLAQQTEIKYGCRTGGSTETFFKKSKVYVYETMWNFMSSQSEAGTKVFMPTNKKGWEHVQQSKGKYAFLLEESFNEYYNHRKPCNTMMVGEKLNSFGYGIGTRKGSNLSKKINLAVLKLRERGELIKLQHKWWVAKGQCDGSSGEKGKRELSLSNVSGIFHILIGGLVLAMVVSVLEYATHLHCLRKKKKGKYKIQKKLDKKKEKPNKGELQPLRPSQGNGPQENKGVGSQYKYQTSSPANNLISFEGVTENGQTQL